MAQIGVSATIGSVGPSNIPTAAYSNAFVVVQSPWGEVNVVKTVTSFSEYLRLFGGLNHIASIASDGTADTWTTATDTEVKQDYYGVKHYFEEKGASSPGVAYVVRVTSGTATAAVRTFTDGSGNNTTITSKWPGLAGGTTEITIINRTTYVLITVNHPQAGIREVHRVGNATEASDASRKSQLVTIALPAGGQLPSAVSSAQKLQNGSAGTADDFAATGTNYLGSVSGTYVKTGLRAFDDFRYGTGFVWASAVRSDSTWRPGLVTHCNTYYRLGLVSAVSGLTTSTVVNSGTTGSVNSTSLASNYTAYYWPQIWVRDDGSTTGGLILVGNEGAMAGLYARMDGLYRGPHKSAAGINHGFQSVTDVERQSSGQELTDDAGSNTLADAPNYVNTIRYKQNRIAVWGMRSQSTDEKFRQVPAGRVASVVYHSCWGELERAAFEPIDPQGNLFAKVEGSLKGSLKRLYKDGVFYGEEPGKDPKPTDGYQAICSRANNTFETIGAGELRADVAIVPTPNAESVRFTIAVASPGFAKTL